MSQGSQVAGFSTDYLIDLVTRFINWQMIGAIFVLLVAGYSCHNGFALPFLWLPYCYG